MHLAFRKEGVGPLPSRPAHLATKGGIAGQAQDAVREAFILAGRRQQAGLPLLHHFANPTNPCGDDGKPRSHCFDEGQWKPFADACEQEQVARWQQSSDIVTSSQQLHMVPDIPACDLFQYVRVFFAVADEQQPRVRTPTEDALHRSHGGGVVLQVVQTGNLEHKQVAGSDTQLLTDSFTAVHVVAIGRQVDAVADDGHALGREALILDERVTYGSADRDHSVAPLQQQPVHEPPFRPGIIRMITPVFGKDHRRPAIEQAGSHRVEERRVLMRMQEVDPFGAQNACQTNRATPIEAGTPLQHMHAKAMAAELLAQHAQFIEADEDEPIRLLELVCEALGQNLGAAYAEGMQDLTDRSHARTFVGASAGISHRAGRLCGSDRPAPDKPCQRSRLRRDGATELGRILAWVAAVAMPAEKLQIRGRIDRQSFPEPSAAGSGGTHSNLPAVLLLTELFPPAVGGSPVLFEAVYSRLKGPRVIVLTDNTAAGPSTVGRDGALTLVRRAIGTKRWGVLDVKGLYHHFLVVREARKIGSRGDVIVHCGRALPEGVAAWFSRQLGGPAYVCWAHGEDITTAYQSREFTWLMTRVYHGAAANIANSHNTGRMFEALGIPPARIRVVYPGVDVRRFQPDIDASDIRSEFGADHRTILLSVGRLQRRKGHDLAIEAISRLDPIVPVRYLIAGEGEERGRLEALVAQHRVQDRVHFLGEVPARDLPRYYAACDIFVLPNRIDNGDVEGFGIVFLEAAATGRPTIGGRTGGVPEAIADRETGVLVGGTDADELAAAIRTLALSEATRRAMGLAGRERVCRGFTWERAAAEVRAVHLEVASKEHAGRERH